MRTGVLVRDARAVAGAWVAEHAVSRPWFPGALFSGSTTELPADRPLPVASDVDVMVVVSGSAVPPKLRKVTYRNVLLDVTFLPWGELTSVAEVAASYYLAASFRSGQVIADPTGWLGRLQEAISGSFRALDPAAAWHARSGRHPHAGTDADSVK